jgi:hypothetical protein
MLAHQGQVYEGMSTPALIKQAAQHFNVVNQSPTTVYDLQLNTLTGRSRTSSPGRRSTRRPT